MAQGSETEQRVIDAMQQLNFTVSDARAYVALLQGHPATGYELAARSGVPRSAIYNVLRRLQSLGLINEIQRKPAKFVPLSPDRLFELLESRFSRSLDSLRDSLDKFAAPTTEAATWSLQGYSAMLDQAEALIRSATRSVHASLWRREAVALHRVLSKATERGLDVVIFSFNELPEGTGDRFAYGVEEADLEQHWEHRVILVCDHERLLVGGAEQREGNRSVVTEEPTILEMAVNNLVLDVTLFGERRGVDVGGVVSRLTRHLAPVDDLIAKSLVPSA